MDEYLVDRNGTQAAIRAGYSERSAKQIASRLLTYDDVQEAIQARVRRHSEQLSIAREEVLKGLVAAFYEARAQGRPMEMIAACREIGRLQGYYPDQARQGCRGGESQRGRERSFEAMSEAELLAITEQG